MMIKSQLQALVHELVQEYSNYPRRWYSNSSTLIQTPAVKQEVPQML